MREKKQTKNQWEQQLQIKSASASRAQRQRNMSPEKNTRSPAIAEGPRDAGVPVEIW